MQKLSEKSEKLNQNYRPRAPVLREDTLDDDMTDEFCAYKVQHLPLKVSMRSTW